MQQGNALAPGTVLLWYEIEKVLGQGAFGITYLAQDTNLHRRVAIKEYLPGQVARRAADGTVEALTSELTQDFTAGCQRFIAEARTLARFEHPNIVRVHNVFEANHTAYMVMQYEEGEGLDRILNRRETLAEPDLMAILHPLLAGLEAVHAQGFLHRDIKPANIFIRRDGTPVLLDFGSARQAVSGDARNLTSFVSPGYAPIEQYAGKGDQQGPWSDIYGLGATLYRAMTGKPPTDAVERSRALAVDSSDSYETLATEGRYSPELIAAVDAALRFRASERPQSIASWREIVPPAPGGANLAGTTVSDAAGSGGAAPSRSVPPIATSPVAADRYDWRLSRLLGVAALLVAIVAGIWVIRRPDVSPEPGAPPAVGDEAPGNAQSAPLSGPAGATPPDANEPAGGTGPAASEPAGGAGPGAETEQGRVAELLYAARLDLEALRLMSPAGRNAYEKYREVLTLEPGNDDAEHGIEAIVDRYVGLAYRDIERKQLARAETYLTRAANLAPKHARVAEARRALDTARTADAAAAKAAAAAAQARGKELEQNFDDFVREQQRTQQAPVKTRGDELLRRLGGER
jgi:hypothetical protein